MTDFGPGDFGILTPGYTGTFSVDATTVSLNLTAVPEPGTFALILCGFGALLFVRRFRPGRQE